jgi:spore cortex formation protein SpoVR/YcgB (stage V sporulation)
MTEKITTETARHVPSQSLEALPSGSDWSFESIKAYDDAIAAVAREFGLDTYPNQIEVISAEQMMDAYASHGMPIGYAHWSYGKHYLSTEQRYKRGQMGLAYEIVINSNPCIAYLMEENTLPMQALVIAHACYGHNSFFKGNYLFKTWTHADSIIDYLVFAKNFVADCERRYGESEVERVLDAAHALSNHGVDRYKRPAKRSLETEKLRVREREAYVQSQVNELWRTLPLSDRASKDDSRPRFPKEPQENLLYFLEKNAPLLEPWERELLRIVRKIAQYFYPQRQTQVMNEGWATFWHYTLLGTLHERNQITDAMMLEVLHSHTNVTAQLPFNHPYYSGLNPYALGFAMFRDIKRICEAPTDEDRKWFPDFAGGNWLETLDYAMRNFKDESFIAQFLSPKVIRDFRLFSIHDDDRDRHYKVDVIHNDEGYARVRDNLSRQYSLSEREPNIQIYDVDVQGDRTLTMRHYRHNRRPLSSASEEVMKHVTWLWGFPVSLETEEPDGSIAHVRRFNAPPKEGRRRGGSSALSGWMR